MSIEQIIAGVIAREGGYVNNPDDKGGPTRFGITEAVARANGYTGAMTDLPIEFAERVYFEKYYRAPGFDKVAEIDPRISEELVDTGVNMGPSVASKFLQRALNALNRKGELFADLPLTGFVGPQTLEALKQYRAKRGADGTDVLLKALNCLQGTHYIQLAEAREQNETFVYGWLRERVKI